MITSVVVVSCLLLLPFLIKIFFVYFAYVQWALATPIPFALRLFRSSSYQPKPKKPPIGFVVALEEPEAIPVSKRKK